jgi:hypothetical protein
MRIAYTLAMGVRDVTEAAINGWHEAVNRKDRAAAHLAVCDPIVVNGPKGAGPITPDGFADWILRSGIELRATSWHPISDRMFVVEQDVRWSSDPDWSHVATVFRATGDRVSAALRFPDLPAALDFAHVYTALIATE